MRFKSFGPLKRLIGENIIDVEIEENYTVLQVVNKVIELYGPEAKHLVMDGEKISGNLIVLLNMRDIQTIGGIEISVHEGDEIAILPHVQGG